MSRVLVLGASGGIGAHVVTEALARGHAVRAFVRNSAWSPPEGDVEAFVGDVTDAASVGAAVEGVDAVLWALGATRNAADQVTTFEVGVRNLVAAMGDHGVRRSTGA